MDINETNVDVSITDDREKLQMKEKLILQNNENKRAKKKHNSRKETPNERKKRKEKRLYLQRQLSSNISVSSNVTVRLLAENIPLYHIRGLISQAEADFLVKYYTDDLYPCEGGRSPKGTCREYQEDMSRRSHPLLALIEERFEGILLNSFKSSDAMRKKRKKSPMNWQLVRYSSGGNFRVHYDLDNSDKPMPITIMAYLTNSKENINEDLECLSNVSETSDIGRINSERKTCGNREVEGVGGYTFFPKENIRILPHKGDVLLWSSCHKNGTLNKDALHAGEPVHSGYKFILNRFYDSDDLRVKKACRLLHEENGINALSMNSFPQTIAHMF